MTQPPRKTGDRRGEPERDAWLTEALRHAPDAQSMPSPALSDAILRKARAATSAAAATEIESSPATQTERAPSIAAARAPNVPSFASRWAAAWSWLARPPVAAAFASVMLATLVGLMWWDQPLDQTLQRRPDALPTPAPSGSPAIAPEPEAKASRAPAPSPAQNAESERSAKDSNSAVLRKSAAPSPPSQPADKAAAAESPQARQKLESNADRDEPRAFQDARSGAASPRLVPEPARAAAPPMVAAAQGMTSAERARTPVADPLSGLLASIAQEPQRWSWRRGGGLQPMSSSLQTWLIQLDANTNSRWTAPPSSTSTSTPPAAGAVSRSDAAATSTDLHLYRGDELQATLRIVDDRVQITSNTAGTSTAELARSTTATLRRTLELAAP